MLDWGETEAQKGLGPGFRVELEPDIPSCPAIRFRLLK